MVPQEGAAKVVAELRKEGYTDADIIGTMIRKDSAGEAAGTKCIVVLE